MTRRVMVVCLVAAAAVAAPKKKKSAAAPPPPPTSPMPKVVEGVGERVLDVMASATHLQTWRVASSGGVQPDKTRAIGADFQREAPGKELAETDTATLRGILYDEKTYRFDADVAKCNFTPDVSFQVQSGIDTVEALVSFKCAQVLFFLGKPGGRWLPGGTFDVKPARAKLLELAKATLPQDAPTQALK